MTDSSSQRPKSPARFRASLASLAVAGVVAVTLMGAAPANAYHELQIGGNIECKNVPNVLIGTESTARGTPVTHYVNGFNSSGTKLSADVGSTTVYSPWGWTFWTDNAGAFRSRGWGVGGHVAGGLARFCTNPFA